jgi:hypothetical protein
MASERIVDTLEFFPHNYQMPQLSSTVILIMAATDMTDDLQNPHPEVPFARVGDDTISALAELVAIFKLKFEKVHIPIITAPPAQVTQRICPAESSNPIVTSTVPRRVKRDHRQQFTLEPKQTRHYFQGWSHKCQVSLHLQGCQDAHKSLLPVTCIKTTSVEWTPPTWPSPLEINIGTRHIKPIQSFTPSPENKWNTRPL